MSGKGASLDVLVVDVGGTNVKVRATGAEAARQFPSGPKFTPGRMVKGARSCAADWRYEAVSIGYPGIVVRNRPVTEPHNLGRGWVGFDYEAAFGCPVRIVNDAAMQALGHYRGGKLLFLGLGTGFGSAMIVDGVVEPMELGHAAWRKSNFEHYLGAAGLARLGRRKWRAEVARVVAALAAALQPDDIVIGGGNVRLLKALPPGCRAGDNANAYAGGLRLWEDAAARARPSRRAPQAAPSRAAS